MTARLKIVSAAAPSHWEGFVAECSAYIEMAVEPEIQRIVHRDGPAVLGDPLQWASQSGCIAAITTSLNKLMEDGEIAHVDAEAAARQINGASLSAAQWIANAADPEVTSKKAVVVFKLLLSGLLRKT